MLLVSPLLQPGVVGGDLDGDGSDGLALDSLPTRQGGHTRYSAIPTSNFLLTGPTSLLRLSIEFCGLSPSTHRLYGGTDLVAYLVDDVTKDDLDDEVDDAVLWWLLLLWSTGTNTWNMPFHTTVI